MGATTKIQWCDHTFNPWRGCTRVSAGCEHCYAERMAKRNPKVLGTWGPDGGRVMATETYWLSPLAWDLAAQQAGVRRRVFCGSMMDVFEARPELVEPRARLWRLIEQTPNLDWFLLTKRPENIEKMLPERWSSLALVEAVNADERKMPFPANAWLGVSCEDREQLDARWPILESLAHRWFPPVLFISAEPLLGPLDGLRAWLHESNLGDEDASYWSRTPDWVIVGGETGPAARPMHADWARGVRDACLDEGVPFFFKAHGEWLHQSQTRADGMNALMYEAGVEVFGGGYGTRKQRWPDGSRSYRVGRAAAGETLDGVTWQEMPGDGVTG